MDGGGANAQENVEFKINPETITVSGAKEDLEPLKEIILGEIKLADIVGSDTMTFPIQLSPELTNVSGVTEATVTVRIIGLETRVLEAESFEYINKPEGCEAEFVTQSLQVLIRGPEEALELVLPHNLRVVADLTDISTAPGRYTVPAKIYLAGTSDVGVVGSDYRVVVSITR